MIDLTGFEFDRIKVTGFSHKKSGHIYWNCVCSCGTKTTVNTQRLRNGATKSCGCLARDKARVTCISRTKHGQSKRSSTTKLYTSWANMKQRCNNSSRSDSMWYHDKGIKVCEKWMSFDGFIDDMSESYFDGASLDRVDNSLGYFKENCRWIDFSKQSRNRTDNRILVIDGVEICMADAAEKYNINYNTLRSRVYKLGMDHKEAVTKPIRGKK